MKKKDLERRLAIIEEKLGIVNGTLKLETGKWYKYPEYEDWKLCIASIDGKVVEGYGVDLNGGWMRSGKWGVIEDKLDELIECTPQEIKEALIKEAKRRGLVDECIINDSNICGFEVYDYKIDNFVGYVMDAVSHELSIKHKKDGVESLRTIFKDGVWAEVRVGEPFFKPEEPKQSEDVNTEPKVGDVCKFWDKRGLFVVGVMTGTYTSFGNKHYEDSHKIRWVNARTLTKQEAIKLLFGDEQNED